VLEIKDMSTKILHSINFDLFEGEILGFYGLVGSGKTEIARAIYGLDKKRGEIKFFGKATSVRSSRKAIKMGIAMLPEERRTEGLCTILSIRDNIPLMNIKSITRKRFFTSPKKEKMLAESYVAKLKIRCSSIDQITAFLSRGNQQKVVISKCLNAGAKILLLDEPTRGVDIGAKDEIHSIIRECSKQNVSTIVFSSDLPEILNLCDRIILLRDGEIKGILKNNSDTGKAIDAELIMRATTGVGEN